MPQANEFVTSAEPGPLGLMPADVWGRLVSFNPKESYGLAKLDPKIEEAICAPTGSLTQEQVKILYLLISLGWLEQKEILITTSGYPHIKIPVLGSSPVNNSRLIDKAVELIGNTPDLKERFLTTAKQMNYGIDYKRYIPKLIICSTLISLVIFGLYKLYSVLLPDNPVDRIAKLGNSCCLSYDPCFFDTCVMISCSDVLYNPDAAYAWLDAREYSISLSSAISQCTALIAQCAKATGASDSFISLLDGSAEDGITGVCTSDDGNGVTNANHKLYFGLICTVGSIVGLVLLYTFVRALSSLAEDVSSLSTIFNSSSLSYEGAQEETPLEATEYAALQATFFKLAKITAKNAEDASHVVVIGERSEAPEEAAPLLRNRH